MEKQKADREFSLKENIYLYFGYWKWFLLGLLLSFVAVYYLLMYSTPLYQSTATALIKDTKQGNAMSELSALEGIGIIGGMNSDRIENEIEILKSRRLIRKVIEKLNLEIQYHIEGTIKSTEIYTEKPFIFSIISKESLPNFYGKSFKIIMHSTESFEIIDLSANTSVNAKYGDKISLEYGVISILPNPEFYLNSHFYYEHPVTVSIHDIEKVLSHYKNAIDINQTVKNSSVLSLSLKSPSRGKAILIIDELITQYNTDAIEDKNIVAKNTALFIEERLSIITKELDSVENNKVYFKQKNHLTDIESESQLALLNTDEVSKQLVELNTKRALVDFIIDQLTNDTEISLLPTNLGITEDGVQGLIHSYNLLVLERNKLLKTSTEQNPVVIAITAQIEQLKINILASLDNAKNSLNTAIADLNKQEEFFESKIRKIPQTEKEFRNIVRQQTVKEELYIFLLQKREETALSLAVTAPKAKIIDEAYSSYNPVFPKKPVFYMIALTFGLGIPFAIIYTRQLLYNRIKNRRDIENYTSKIPILGEIPKINLKENKLIKPNDSSILAESFRIIRTNLDYIFAAKKDLQENGKIIIVTSSIKGEGKTFTAINLSLSFANLGKKVLLIGGDLRNPRLHEYLSINKNLKGFTNFLVNSKDTKTIEEYIVPSGVMENHFYLLSGSIPPNPAELLSNEKTADTFTYLRTVFDYIVIDTAPSMLVADTFLIQKYADLIVYVAKADYSEKELLKHPLDCINDGRFRNNLAFLLNNVSKSNFGYGNKYGYTYGKEKKTSWFNKFKTLFAI